VAPSKAGKEGSTGLSVGAIIGIVVGILLVVVVGVVIWLYRRNATRDLVVQNVASLDKDDALSPELNNSEETSFNNFQVIRQSEMAL
jgi:sensor domain CHASE-containing protein